MIQLNLLPDVKLEYIKAQRQRMVIITVAILITVVSIAILGVNVLIGQVQKKHLSDLNKDITASSKKLQSQPQINKILTVQNQLLSLTSLHDAKPATSRLFDYMNQLTPVEASIASLEADTVGYTITITGAAKTVSDVNRYVDILKFTEYTSTTTTTSTKAFSDVVLSSFSAASAEKKEGQPVTYSIALVYDPLILSTTEKVVLKVPSRVTTRSELNQPNALFEAAKLQAAERAQ